MKRTASILTVAVTFLIGGAVFTPASADMFGWDPRESICWAFPFLC